MDKHSLFTFNFKSGIVFVVKLAVLFGMIVFFLIKLSPQYLMNYQASLIDKVERAEKINEPKIVLLGNSNLSFGIESEKIEESIHMPVVNMGLHGGLGNVFHERMALLNVNEGDIYIICHSSYADDGEISDKALAWITIENHFDLWRILRREDVKPMLKAYPVYLKKCISLWMTGGGNIDAGGVYSRSAFNEYGDIEWEDSGCEYDFSEYQSCVPDISDNVVERLNNLKEYLESKGATLLLAGYPIADTSNRSSDEDFINFENELKEKMNAPVISHYTDYIYPCDYFFNTNLHLNNAGKQVRTNQLIKDLTEYLEETVRQDS